MNGLATHSYMLTPIKIWFSTHKRIVITLALFFLSSTISFALGYLMAGNQNRAPIIIEKAR